MAAAPSAPTTVVSYYLAVNEQTAALAMANKPAQLRLALAAAACQFVEAKHKGIALRRGSWRIRVSSFCGCNSRRAVPLSCCLICMSS